MASRRKFQFKKFTIHDDKCALKLGTDAVLLGAWTSVKNNCTKLDIGTGCGILAMMLAQRSTGRIDAIDIHLPSIRQAGENFKNSLWNSQLKEIYISLQEFSASTVEKYGLIISNPPYFENDLKSPDELKNISRHNDHLTFEELNAGVNKLLEPNGIFSLILPHAASSQFEFAANLQRLYCHHETIVFPKPDKKPNRVLLEYRKEPVEKKKTSSLTIRHIDNSYTKEYIELTQNFYLNF